MQLTSLLSDGLRVNLWVSQNAMTFRAPKARGLTHFASGQLSSAKQLCLALRAGHKLNPLSSVLIFAPVSSVFLLLIGLVSDPGSISQEEAWNNSA